MANDTTSNPWVLDTAAEIATEQVMVESMEWVPNAAANDLIVKDSAGNIKWDVDAIAGGTPGKEVTPWNKPLRMIGFDLDTIDGGTLYVYLA